MNEEKKVRLAEKAAKKKAAIQSLLVVLRSKKEAIDKKIAVLEEQMKQLG